MEISDLGLHFRHIYDALSKHIFTVILIFNREELNKQLNTLNLLDNIKKY